MRLILILAIFWCVNMASIFSSPHSTLAPKTIYSLSDEPGTFKNKREIGTIKKALSVLGTGMITLAFSDPITLSGYPRLEANASANPFVAHGSKKYPLFSAHFLYHPVMALLADSIPLRIHSVDTLGEQIRLPIPLEAEIALDLPALVVSRVVERNDHFEIWLPNQGDSIEPFIINKNLGGSVVTLPVAPFLLGETRAYYRDNGSGYYRFELESQYFPIFKVPETHTSYEKHDTGSYLIRGSLTPPGGGSRMSYFSFFSIGLDTLAFSAIGEGYIPVAEPNRYESYLFDVLNALQAGLSPDQYQAVTLKNFISVDDGSGSKIIKRIGEITVNRLKGYFEVLEDGNLTFKGNSGDSSIFWLDRRSYPGFDSLSLNQALVLDSVTLDPNTGQINAIRKITRDPVPIQTRQGVAPRMVLHEGMRLTFPELPAKTRIRLHGANGKTIKQVRANGGLDMSELKSGIYFITMQGNSLKIIKAATHITLHQTRGQNSHFRTDSV